MDMILDAGFGLALLAIIAGLVWAFWLEPKKWADRTRAVMRLAEEQGWQYLPEPLVLERNPSKRVMPAGLRGSVLAAFKDVRQYY